MEDARGYRGIPAFGEWNYGHGADGGDYDWSVLTERFESAITMQISFPVHKQPCRKRAKACRGRRVPAFGEWNNDYSYADGEDGWMAAVNQCFEPAVKAHKSLKQVEIMDDSAVVATGKQLHKARQAWVPESGPHLAMEPFSFAVVEAVDDDLYEVPTEMLCSKSVRRKGRSWMRSLLTRCFGLNCFA